jgi:DNA polymerase-4/DNA polymerase V
VHGITYEEILRKIQDDIQKELNISVSIGCGATKALAKIGSKWDKPHGITVITRENTKEFLSHIPINDIWGIGPRSASQLLNRGIQTAYDFASLSLDSVFSFTHKPLKDLWNELNCNQVYLVNTHDHEEDQQSISRTLSFYPYKTNHSELFSELSRNVENACIRARKSELATSRVAWFLKTKENNYEVYKIKLEHPTNIPSVIIAKIKEQFDRMNIKGKLYKTTGVTLSHLIREDSIQRDLFDFYKEMDSKSDIFKVVDLLNQKYGRHMVHLASSTRGISRHRETYTGRNQMVFFDKIKKTGKELSIPYLGETI